MTATIEHEAAELHPAVHRSWFARLRSVLSQRAQQLVIRLLLILLWPFRRPGRMLWVAWLTGFFVVGQAGSAYADDIIPSPGTPDGQAPTPFESVPLGNYELLQALSESHHGVPYVEQSMWGIISGISNVMLYMTFSFVRGAVTCMQWMLQLNLYQENKYEIDAAVLSLADQIFWPLFATTLAIAGCVMYVRSKREGGGSIANDLVWILAASVLAVTFAGIPGSESRYTPKEQQDCIQFGECPDNARLGPSAIMSDLDDFRRLLALGAIKGFAGAPQTSASAAGFKPTEFGTGESANSSQPGLTETNAVRKLADSMWNVYAVTPWCFAQYNSLAACKFDAKGDGIGEGAHYLLRDAVWQERQQWLSEDGNHEDGDGASPKCPAEWSADGAGGGVSPGQCDWIRGQSFGRLGVVFLMTLISLPMALLLLGLVLFAVMSIVGFILLILIGLVFLLGWMIPGRLRQIGVRWFETVLATLLQSVVITTVLGGVMVLGGILNAGIPKYGFFMVALLHFGTFIAAFKVRGHFESITQMSSPTSSAPVSQYMAMKMLSSAGRVGRFAGRKGDQAVTGIGNAAHSSTIQAGRGVRQYSRDAMAGSLRPLMPRATMATDKVRDGFKVAFPPAAGQSAGGGPGRAAAAGMSPVSPAGAGPGRGNRSGRSGTASSAGSQPATLTGSRGEPSGSGANAVSQQATAVQPVSRLRPQGDAHSSAAPTSARDPYAPTRSVTPPNLRRSGVGGPSVRTVRSSGAAVGSSAVSARVSGPPRPPAPVRPAAERPSAPTQPGGGSAGRGAPVDPYQPTRTVRPPSRAVGSGNQPPAGAAPAQRPSTPATSPAAPTPPAGRAPAPRRPSPGSEGPTTPPAAQRPATPPRTRGTGPWRSQPPRHRRDDDGRPQ